MKTKRASSRPVRTTWRPERCGSRRQSFRFERKNAFGGAPPDESLAEGIRLRNLCQLALASLAFKATVHRPVDDPNSLTDRVGQLCTWHLPAITPAESDDGPRAIQALVQVQANGGANEARALEATSALTSVMSYVNELDKSRATRTLRQAGGK